MSGTVAASHDNPEQRIYRALDRIEKAAANMDMRQGQLRQTVRDALADIDRLIVRASAHG